MVLGAYGIAPWNNFAKPYLAATQVRKDFTLSQLPPRAVLYVTGQGLVEPRLNGAKVGNDCFVPGWTDYATRLYYFSYDVTSLLQPGSNTLGPILQCDNEAGESYDARLETPGWDSPGFSNASWKPVTTGAQISPAIQAYPAEAVQTNQAILPVAITQPQPGLYVINFGQNIAGWARLQVTNQPAGRRIVMRFGEWLNPDGTVFRDNLRLALAAESKLGSPGSPITAFSTWRCKAWPLLRRPARSPR